MAANLNNLSLDATNAYPGVGMRTTPVYKLIEYAFRQCGKLAEEQTPQYIEAAQTALQYLLQDISNRGEVLFLWDQVLIGPRVNTRQYQLPVGTIDVRVFNWLDTQNFIAQTALPVDNPTSPNCFDGSLNNNVAQGTANLNWFGLDLGLNNDSRPTYVGINGYTPNLGTSTYNLVLEWSGDGVVWQLATLLPSYSVPDGQWQYWSLDGQPTARYWRVRQDVATGILAIRQLVFGNTNSTIPLARLNRDDYWNLPDKNSNRGSRSLQYWFDRQVTPLVNFWPVPQDDFQIFEMLLEQQMPDVMTLSQVINVPNRWLPAIQMGLASSLSLLLPNVDQNRIALLKQLADEAMTNARLEERDKSPLYLRPTTRYYSGGP